MMVLGASKIHEYLLYEKDLVAKILFPSITIMTCYRLFTQERQYGKRIYAATGLLWLLISGKYSRQGSFNRIRVRAKFGLRSLITLPWTLKWLDIVLRSPELKQYLKENPGLGMKLHRPYLYRSLRLNGKINAIREHYHLLGRILPLAMSKSIFKNERVVVATLSHKEKSILNLVLTQQHTNQREGEISLQLCDGSDIAICTMTFTFHFIDNKRTITIGGLQGPKKPLGAEIVRAATKSCYGLFPKRIVTEAIVILARQTGVTQIRSVSNKEHVFNSLRYRKSFVDYDIFWETLPGTRKMNKIDMYCIPLVLQRKPIQEVPTRKRADYKRRYELMDDIAMQLSRSIKPFTPVPGMIDLPS